MSTATIVTLVVIFGIAVATAYLLGVYSERSKVARRLTWKQGGEVINPNALTERLAYLAHQIVEHDTSGNTEAEFAMMADELAEGFQVLDEWMREHDRLPSSI